MMFCCILPVPDAVVARAKARRKELAPQVFAVRDAVSSAALRKLLSVAAQHEGGWGSANEGDVADLRRILAQMQMVS